MHDQCYMYITRHEYSTYHDEHLHLARTRAAVHCDAVFFELLAAHESHADASDGRVGSITKAHALARRFRHSIDKAREQGQKCFVDGFTGFGADGSE